MKVLVVGSGKGGTGKTTAAALIATHLTSKYNVGLIDADLSCPSISQMFDFNGESYGFAPGGLLKPLEFKGVANGNTLRVFSIGSDIPREQHVVWSGRQLSEMLRDQFTSVDWGDASILVVDLPPSTSDSVQSVLSICGKATVCPVTINSDLAVTDTLRFLTLCQKYNLIIKPIIKNMADIYEVYEKKDFNKIIGLETLCEIPFNHAYAGERAGQKMLNSLFDNRLATTFERLIQ